MSEVIVIAGPTGVGKSDLAVELAQRIGAEIVSADSVQIYKGMDIGSAKVSSREMKGIKHHMIDLLRIDEDCDAVKFRDMARACVDDILSRGKRVIIAGGTGFYIGAIIRNTSFASNGIDTKYRDSLYRIADLDEGKDRLYDMLLKKDPRSAADIEKNNVKRVIRALEFFHSTGKSLSVHNEEERRKPDYYPNQLYVLYDEREKLYSRIDARVDSMIEAGLEEEVRALYQKYPQSRILNSAIGYKEMIGYIKGEHNIDEAVRLIKRNTRHFAKRQLTYFKFQLRSEFLHLNIGRKKLLETMSLCRDGSFKKEDGI